MQLSAHKASSSVLPGGLAEDVRWDGDLMDVDADADDWNAFESAPVHSGGPNAVGAGWGTVTTADDEDPWGAFEDPAPPPVPIPVTELTSSPLTVTPARTPSAQTARPARVAALSPSSSPRTTPLASPAPSEGAAFPTASSPSSVPSKAGMTKEEKAAEMARRKEERKQRIAQLKEQKKNNAGAKA